MQRLPKKCVYYLSLFLLVLAGRDPDIPKWGRTFDVSLESRNVLRDCALSDGTPICCAAVNDSLIETRGVGIDYHFLRNGRSHVQNNHQQARRRILRKYGKVDGRGDAHHNCILTKEYFPSPHELLHFRHAHYLNNITEYLPRWDNLTEILVSDEMISDSNAWLERVRERMQAGYFDVSLLILH